MVPYVFRVFVYLDFARRGACRNYISGDQGLSVQLINILSYMITGDTIELLQPSVCQLVLSAHEGIFVNILVSYSDFKTIMFLNTQIMSSFKQLRKAKASFVCICII